MKFKNRNVILFLDNAQPKILSLSEAIGMMDDLTDLLKEGFKMNLLSHPSTKFAV